MAISCICVMSKVQFHESNFNNMVCDIVREYHFTGIGIKGLFLNISWTLIQEFNHNILYDCREIFNFAPWKFLCEYFRIFGIWFGDLSHVYIPGSGPRIVQLCCYVCGTCSIQSVRPWIWFGVLLWMPRTHRHCPKPLPGDGHHGPWFLNPVPSWAQGSE